MLLQRPFKRKSGWDDSVGPRDNLLWVEFLASLMELENKIFTISVPESRKMEKRVTHVIRHIGNWFQSRRAWKVGYMRRRLRHQDNADQNFSRTFEFGIDPTHGIKCGGFGSECGADCFKSIEVIVVFWTDPAVVLHQTRYMESLIL